MCRLLGYVTRTPATLASLLGETELYEFTELSCKHGDGWGAAWATDAGVEVVKAPDAARMSDAFARHVHGHTAEMGLLHLRWATLGLEVATKNTHPFTDGRIAFAHNGSITPPAALDALVPDDLRRERHGDTDSERYFLAALAAARAAGPAGGLAATVARISAYYEFNSLNALLLTPEELVAVCRYDPAAQDLEEEPDYYRLRYRVTPDAVVVSSSGWGAGWTELENGEVLVVQRDTLEVSVGLVTDRQVIE